MAGNFRRSQQVAAHGYIQAGQADITRRCERTLARTLAALIASLGAAVGACSDDVKGRNAGAAGDDGVNGGAAGEATVVGNGGEAVPQGTLLRGSPDGLAEAFPIPAMFQPRPVGDINGDGLADVAGPATPTVRVYYGAATGMSAGPVLEAPAGDERRFGASVAGL